MVSWVSNLASAPPLSSSVIRRRKPMAKKQRCKDRRLKWRWIEFQLPLKGCDKKANLLVKAKLARHVLGQRS